MDNWYEWLNKTRFDSLDSSMLNASIEWLNQVRDLILLKSKIRKTDTVLDIGCGNGLLGLKILSAQNGLGNVIFLEPDKECLEYCRKSIDKLSIKTGFELINSNCECMPISSESVDKVVMRSVLAHIDNKQKAINEIYRVMKKNSIFCGFEPVISQNMHYWQILPESGITNYEKFKEIEEKIWNDNSDSLLNYNYENLEYFFKNSNFNQVTVSQVVVPLKIKITNKIIDGWFLLKPAPNKLCLKDRFLKYEKDENIEQYISEIKTILKDKEINIPSHFALIVCVK